MSTKILWNYFLKSSGIGGPVFMDNKSKNTASAGSNKNNTKIELFTLPSALYAEGSPVLLYGGSLVMDRFTERLSVTLQLRNVDERSVIAATVYIQPYGIWGEPYPQEVIYRYNSLKAVHDQTFGSKRLIPMPDNGVRSFTAFISEVTFGDYSSWKNEKPFEPIGRARELEDALGDEDSAHLFTARYGNDCAYLPLIEKDLWFCTCGAINKADSDRCYNCRRNKDAFQMVNYGALKSDAKKVTAKEKQLDEEEHREKKEKGRIFLKVAMTVLPILLAAVLIIATIPPYIARREAYANAQEYLSSGKYDEAQVTFAALGNYLDSQIMAEKGVQYAKALAIMKGAEKADSTTLALAGISRNDVSADENISLILYGKAKEILVPLGDYEEAPAKVKEIDAAFTAYEEQQILDRYNKAVTLLDEKAYLAARDAFLALGDYKDSADMVSECLYRRACEMLSFCEENKTRGIYVFSSSDPSVESLVSMPGSVLTTLGSERVFQLKQCFTRDGVQFNYEESPSSDVAHVPVCEATALEFEALGDYKDSKDLAARARAAGNYTAEFYQLLADGELEKAHEWLSSYGDEVPNADQYDEWIVTYYSFCKHWTLSGGDVTLIPFSAGVESPETLLIDFSPRISIVDDTVTLTIADDEETYSVSLTAKLGETVFTYQTDNETSYTAFINDYGFLIYNLVRYGESITLCEYKPAA